MAAHPLPLFVPDLDRHVGPPLHHQLYGRLRDAILAGRLAPGDRLPASRSLARELELSRNTVLSAYDQLHAEGYLVGRIGSGSFVTSELPVPHAPSSARAPRAVRTRPPRGPSSRGRTLTAMPVSGSIAGPPGPFRIGVPALDAFPVRTWSRLMARAWADAGTALFGYATAAGYQPLRDAIATYLGTSRAVRCDASQVIVTSGAQQALYLATQVLLEPGDRVWFEDPGYRGARVALQAGGAVVVPVPLDSEGLRLDQAARSAPAARAVYVTPSHQYPLGVTMSLGRRLELLAWASRRNAWIIEDDYDSEYRYAGRPLASLQGLDTDDRVIYIGSFSKVLCPALRLGYMVVPKPLVEAFIVARGVADRFSPTVDQIALARFMQDGGFARHIRRMRALYAERQQVLVEEAARHLGGRLDVSARPAGLHLVGWLPDGADDVAAAARARSQGIDAPALSNYHMRGTAPKPGLLLGYAGVDTAAIRTGVRTLAAALDDRLTRPARSPRPR